MKKVTATLVNKVSASLIKQSKLSKSIFEGAKDEYCNVEYSPLIQPNKECSDEPTKPSNPSNSPSSKNEISTIVTNLEIGHMHIQDIVSNIENYTPQDLNVVSEALAKLDQVATNPTQSD